MNAPDNENSIRYQNIRPGISSVNQVLHKTTYSANHSPPKDSVIIAAKNVDYAQSTLEPFTKTIENTRQVPPALKYPSSSTGDLLPGIDLDAVALMMQGGKGK